MMTTALEKYEDLPPLQYVQFVCHAPSSGLSMSETVKKSKSAQIINIAA